MGDVDQPARETRRDGPTGNPPERPVDGPRATTRDAASGAPAAGVTRRDTASHPGGPGTSGPGAGAPEDKGAGPGTGWPLVRMPGALAERYTVIGEVPAHGAEADLLHVRDGAGDECVVKVFRAGFSADRTVWSKLPDIDSPYVVRIHETGHADGRDYEVMEYVAGGNLRALAARGRPPAAEMVADVVAQLTAGLRRLHEAGIVHRDLKPENVLVRSARPVRLAITDFGLSKVIDQSVVFASSSRTLAYAAPESLSGQVSPARDWWSLGLIIRELLTGQAPFGGMSETAVLDHLATRPIDVDGVDDSRMRLLCRGLLARDPRRRWGAPEVEAWLRGESPAAAEDTAGPGATGTRAEPLTFGGRGFDHRDRAELARALVAGWPQAARHFFSAPHTMSGPSEASRALRGWLRGFGAAPGAAAGGPGGGDADAEGRIALVDRHLAGVAPPDVKLLHLVRWLDPGLPPHYLGRRVLPGDLAGLAAIARQHDHADHATAARIGRDLWDHRLLPVLAGFSGGYGPAAADAATDTATSGDAARARDATDGADGVADLDEVDARWRGLVTAWNRQAARLRTELAAGVRLPDAGAQGEDEPPVVLLTLLALAARPARTARELAGAAAAARRSVPAPVEWFDRLADPAGDHAAPRDHGGPGDHAPPGDHGGPGAHGAAGAADPLRLLAVVCAAPAAAAEAAGTLREERTERRRTAERERHWAEREQRRLAGRTAAMVRAALWSLPLLVLWFGGSWLVFLIVEALSSERLTGGRDNSRLLLPALALAGAAFVVELACEVVVASRQGRDYLPAGPWSWVAAGLRGLGGGLSRVSRFFSAGARRLGSRGGGCLLLIVAGLPLLLLLVAAPALLALAPLLWLAVLAFVPVIHVIVAGVRLNAWRREHERARDRAIGAGGVDESG